MRVVGITLAMLALLLLGAGSPVTADAFWPWSNNDSSGTRAAKSKTAEKSAFSKLTTGTKDFFGGLFGLKKSDSKKKPAVRSYPSAKKNEPKKESWLTSWLGPKEPPPPRSTREWMQLEQIRP